MQKAVQAHLAELAAEKARIIAARHAGAEALAAIRLEAVDALLASHAECQAYNRKPIAWSEPKPWWTSGIFPRWARSYSDGDRGKVRRRARCRCRADAVDPRRGSPEGRPLLPSQRGTAHGLGETASGRDPGAVASGLRIHHGRKAHESGNVLPRAR
jgi:hypothetical protein